MDGCLEISFNPICDERGKLIAVSGNNEIPFEIKRFYYMFDLNYDAVRGGHAHKMLQQVLVCFTGECKIIFDNGITKHSITLNNPTQAIYVHKPLWRDIYPLSNNCVLGVFASDFYDPEDYIRNYSDFVEYIKP
jgi:dTDP-4-dehydrorhamnose 3,5-epimerase-like enzyme